MSRDSGEYGGRVNYLGNHDMVQGFEDPYESTAGQNPWGEFEVDSKKKGSLTPGGGREAKLETLQESKLELKEPEDYGRDYYELLRKVHKERTACEDPSAEELFGTFKIISNSLNSVKEARTRAANQAQAMGASNTNPYLKKPAKSSKISVETQMRLTGSTFNSKTQMEDNKALGAKLDIAKDKDPDSVRYTIKLHHETHNQEKDLQRKVEHGILRKQREKKLEQRKKEVEKKQREVQKKYEPPELYKGRQPDQYELFVKGVKKLHKQAKPEDKDYIYPQKLYEHWATLPEDVKKTHKLDMDKQLAHETFHRYFNTRLQCLFDHYYKQKGSRTEDPKVLFMHWKEIYPAAEKKDKDLEFESDDNAKKLIDDWMRLLRRQEQERKDRILGDQKARLLEDAAKAREKRGEAGAADKPLNHEGKPMTEKEVKKAEQEKRMRELANPKDRLIKGKTAVELAAQFPEDKVLRKLVIEEFQNDRIVKRPLEYDDVDSEEEDLIKGRIPKPKHKKNSEKGKRMEDIWVSKPQIEKKRAKELANKFMELTKKYQLDKNKELNADKSVEEKVEKEREKFDIFLESKVIQYRKLMLSKQNQTVPSETQYLSDVRAASPSSTKKPKALSRCSSSESSSTRLLERPRRRTPGPSRSPSNTTSSKSTGRSMSRPSRKQTNPSASGHPPETCSRRTSKSSRKASSSKSSRFGRRGSGSPALTQQRLVGAGGVRRREEEAADEAGRSAELHFRACGSLEAPGKAEDQQRETEPLVRRARDEREEESGGVPGRPG